MYRLTSQITRCHHLTSPGLQRTARALFIQMEGADAAKGMNYKEKSSAGAFWCPNESWAAQTLDVIHRQTRTRPNKSRPCKLSPTICVRDDAFFFMCNKNSAELFQNMSALQRFIVFLIPLMHQKSSSSCALDYKTKQVIFFLKMLQKQPFLRLFLTNASRGCCYLQPSFFRVKSITAPPSLTQKPLTNSFQNFMQVGYPSKK